MIAQFAQATLNGLLLGGLFALVAVGFSLVWGVTHVINLAHGAFVVMGAYVAYWLHEWIGLDPFLSMIPAAALLFAVGYPLQRYLINLVVNGPIFITLLLTFGLRLILVQGLISVFTGDFRTVQTSYSGAAFTLPGDVRVPIVRLIAFGLAVGLTLGLGFMLRRTRMGLAILATGMDRGAARLMGIRATHVYALTFGTAAAMAGVAGAALSGVQTFSPADSFRLTLFSFVASVIGGLGNPSGALMGGLLLGLFIGWGGQLLSGTLVYAVAYAVLVVLLAVRPQGLGGKAFYAARVEV